MSSLGIYFGPKIITIVETKGRNLINNTQILQSSISTGELEERVPAEVKAIEIIALFKDELRRNKILAKEASLCLSGKDLIIRTFEIPMLPREELQSAINFEAKKYIPFKVEDLISDFQLKFDRTSRTNLVLFVGIKKETLDRYISILNQLAIKIHTIEYSAFSVLRCLNLTGSSTHGITGVLAADLSGRDEVNFTVLENGFPLFSRDITLTSGPEILGEIEESQRGLALEKLKTEIRVSLDYYQRKFPTKNIKKIFLLFNQEHHSDVEAFMRDIGLSVEFINIAKHLKKPIPYSLSFIKGYSASLSRTIKSQIKLNLLEAKEKVTLAKEKAPAKEAVSLLKSIKLDFRIVALGLLIIGGTYVFGLYRKQPLSQEFNNIISKRAKVVTVNPDAAYEELAKRDSEYKEKLKTLEKLIMRQLYVTEILNIVSRSTPKESWLTHLYFARKGEGKVELTLEGLIYSGNSEEEFAIANNFLSKLKDNSSFNKYFKEISIASLAHRQSEKLTATNFQILCKPYEEKVQDETDRAYE